MTSDPTLVARDALEGVTVAISVSDSDDLSRLGLDQRHLDIAVSELVRAVVIAGGSVVYGGRVTPLGFTQQVMHEVSRFASARHAFTLCLAYPEHTTLSAADAAALNSQLGLTGRVVALDIDGEEVPWGSRVEDGVKLDDSSKAQAYSGMRRHLSTISHARVLVGGRLSGYAGVSPGIVEECAMSVAADQPIYVAGGFGGAACEIARRFHPDNFGWLSADVPAGADSSSSVAALDALFETIGSGTWAQNGAGLTDAERRQLATSHRPGEIAGLCVLGIARTFGTTQAGSD